VKYPYDAFISYATEDEKYAESIEKLLTFSGFKIWFAPLTLEIGDRLLDSINAGLNSSRFGIIILSPDFIKKPWTGYELDVLHRQHIEKNKRLLPIWHNIEKQQIDEWNPGVTGIVGFPSSKDIGTIIARITGILSDNAPTRGVVPCYERPSWRFLQGLGELFANTENGGAFNIYEAVEFPDKCFPIYIDGACRSKKELVLNVASIIVNCGRDRIRVGTEEQWLRIRELCKSFGYNVDDENFDPADHG